MKTRRWILPATVIVLTSLGSSVFNTGCGGGHIVEPSPQSFLGRLFDRSGGAPLSGINVVARSANGMAVSSAVTDSSGTFSLEGVQSGSRIVVNRPDMGQNFYTIGGQSASLPAVDFFLDPIAAEPQTSTPGQVVTPSVQDPAGTAFIETPVTSGSVTCNSASSSTICRFGVTGTADPRLGQPGSTYHAYLLVHPTNPSGLTGFVLQPELAVDPATGRWSAEAQIGPTTHPGDQFEMAVVVSSELLTPDPAISPRGFPTPQQVPGVVFAAPFARDVRVGTLP